MWVERIEQLRAKLDVSTEKVSRVDFGAGLRAETGARGDAEMAGGVQVEDEVQRISRSSSKSGLWALFLFKLIRGLRPRHCLEMGTALGLSGAYQAAALQLNGYSSFTSLEGSAELAAIARRNWESLGLRDARVIVGRFADTLGGVLAAEPMDYVFIDGHHDEAATLDYFERLSPKLASPACLVFDDITWSAGMRHAWRVVTEDARVKVSVDFGPVGVAIVGALDRRRPARAPLA